MKLLISQKDKLFEIIENDNNFTPSQFEINEICQGGNKIMTEFKFKNSDYYYKFFPDTESASCFYANYSPGVYSNIDYTTRFVINDESNKLFKQWLFCLNRELNAPNKWERLQNEIQSLNINFNEDNSNDKFSFQEYTDLSNKIDILKQNIKSINFSSEQLNAIDIKLDDLKELAKNLKRFDWRNLFIGTIISIIIQLEVNKDNANDLWRLIKHIFSNLFLQ